MPYLCQKFKFKIQPKTIEASGNNTTYTNPIIHLFYPPKICIGIVLDYSGDMFMFQEKLQTMSMQSFGGLKRCIMVLCK